MDTSGQRMKSRRKLLKLTQTQAAGLSGISQGAWSEMEKSTSPAYASYHWVGIAKALQTTPEWLQHGEGDPDQRIDIASMRVNTPNGEEVWDLIYSITDYKDGEVITNSAISMTVPPWMSEQFNFSPVTTYLLSVKDDASAPERPKGTVVLVDSGKKALVDAALYCIYLQGKLTLRRIYLELDGSMRIACDNPNKTHFPDKILPAGAKVSFVVIGRAIAKMDV